MWFRYSALLAGLLYLSLPLVAIGGAFIQQHLPNFFGQTDQERLREFGGLFLRVSQLAAAVLVVCLILLTQRLREASAPTYLRVWTWFAAACVFLPLALVVAQAGSISGLHISGGRLLRGEVSDFNSFVFFAFVQFLCWALVAGQFVALSLWMKSKVLAALSLMLLFAQLAVSGLGLYLTFDIAWQIWSDQPSGAEPIVAAPTMGLLNLGIYGLMGFVLVCLFFVGRFGGNAPRPA